MSTKTNPDAMSDKVRDAQQKGTEGAAVDGTPNDESLDHAEELEAARARIAFLNKESEKHRLQANEFEKQLKLLNEQIAADKRTDLEEREEFKQLYEQSAQQVERLTAELSTLQEEATLREMEALRRDVAKAKGLPESMANRLRGETRDELEADADSLLADMPKPDAPNMDGAKRTNTRTAELPADEQIAEEAARLGVDFTAYKQAMERRGKR